MFIIRMQVIVSSYVVSFGRHGQYEFPQLLVKIAVFWPYQIFLCSGLQTVMIFTEFVENHQTQTMRFANKLGYL